MELQFDTATPTRKTVRLQTEAHDTPEMVAAALAAINGTAGAGTPTATKLPILFSQLVGDYKRDRLAAKKWVDKTQDENLAIYKPCMEIIGDIPIADIDEDRALHYCDTLQKLPPNMSKPPHKGKSIEEIIACNPTPMATRTITKALNESAACSSSRLQNPNMTCATIRSVDAAWTKAMLNSANHLLWMNLPSCSAPLNMPNTVTRLPIATGYL